MKERYRLGIIGAGGITETNHLPSIKNIEELEVQWIYDKNPARSKLLSEMYNINAVNELTDAQWEQVDICLLAIPYGFRNEYIHKCASLGKALYVEKPFATTVAEHQAYAALFRPGHLAIGFQRRYYKTIAVLEFLVQSGLFGKLLKIEFNQGYFSLKGGAGHLSDAKLSGGGVIIESAIHALDQILMITHATGVSVDFVRSVASKGIDYDTEFGATITAEQGQIQLSAGISTLRNLDNGVTFQFESAIVRTELNADEAIHVVPNNGDKFKIDSISGFTCSRPVAASMNTSFYFFWKEFLQGYKNSMNNITEASSSILTTALIEGLYARIN